jgi:hypothetical protein
MMNMLRKLLHMILLLGLLILVAACDSAEAISSQTSKVQAQGRDNRVSVVVLTERDNNTIKHIRQGQVVQIHFSSGDAEKPLLSKDLLVLRQSATPQARGTSGRVWEFVAMKPGITVISSSIAPDCKAGKPCMQFFLLWHVTIVVTA